MNDKTFMYVSIGKPLIFKKFLMRNKPCGMYRLSYLKEKLDSNKKFKAKFTTKELKEIFDYE